MDSGLCQHLVYLTVQGPLAVSFWLALVWFILLLSRREVLKVVWRWLGIKDEVLKRELSKKLELPFSILLIVLAFLPFIKLLGGGVGDVVGEAASFLAALLAFHLLIQSLDLFVVRWYLGTVKGTTVSPAFHFLFFSILYVSVLLLLMDVVLKVNVLPLLATSTIATAVLGLALQDTLKNIFAGVTLSMEKSVRPGDWVSVRLDGGTQVTGEVSEIGWRSTRIRTSNNNNLIVPNGQFVSQQLVNLTFPNSTHAESIDIPVSRDFQPQSVTSALLEATSSVKEVLTEPKPLVFAREMSSSEIDYRITYFTDRIAEREMLKGLVIQSVWEKLASIGAITRK